MSTNLLPFAAANLLTLASLARRCSSAMSSRLKLLKSRSSRGGGVGVRGTMSIALSASASNQQLQLAEGNVGLADFLTKGPIFETESRGDRFVRVDQGCLDHISVFLDRRVVAFGH